MATVEVDIMYNQIVKNYERTHIRMTINCCHGKRVNLFVNGKGIFCILSSYPIQQLTREMGFRVRLSKMVFHSCHSQYWQIQYPMASVDRKS